MATELTDVRHAQERDRRAIRNGDSRVATSRDGTRQCVLGSNTRSRRSALRRVVVGKEDGI